MKNLLIIGSGRCIWEDYFKARELFETREVMCVNFTAFNFKTEPVHHIVSLHRQVLDAKKAISLMSAGCTPFTCHGSGPSPGTDKIWEKDVRTGNSGMFAIVIALRLNYKKIILCGLPADNTGHYYDPPANLETEKEKKKCRDYGSKTERGIIEGLKSKNELVSSRVRSMSGMTAEIFGKPSKEWVNAVN